MNELLEIIDQLSADERRDLIVIMSLKYHDDFLQANRFVYWPRSIENASERVKQYIEKYGHPREAKDGKN